MPKSVGLALQSEEMAPATRATTKPARVPTQAYFAWVGFFLGSRPTLRALPSELEVESNLGGQRSRRHIMCTAEGRQEVVQCIFVRQVDRRKLQTPLVTITLEKVVVTDRQIKKASRCDTRRIVIVVFSPR